MLVYIEQAVTLTSLFLIITAFDKILNILTKYNLQAHTCWSKNVTLTLLFELARE